MNWTSGRLNRSTKATKDPVRRKQRRYFARQRIDNGKHTHSPLSLAHFLHDTVRNAEQAVPVTSHHFTSTPHSHPPHESDQIHPRLTSTRTSIDPPTEESLSDVRRRLLKIKDWTSLAIVRPAAINFRSAADMDRIGRRRNVARKPTKHVRRLPRNRPKPQDAKIVHAMKQGRELPPISDLHSMNCSIRHGSNIHQSQTTNLAESTHDSISMDWNGAGQQVTTLSHIPRHCPELHLEHGAPEMSGAPLLPLDHVRSLKSFDEVQQRSSSLASQMSISSNPFVTESTRSKASSNPCLRSSKRDYPIDLPSSSKHTIEHVSRRYRTDGDHRSSESSPHRSDDIREPLGAVNALSADGEEYDDNFHEKSPMFHSPIPPRHRFTLDQQVLLEKQLAGTPSDRSKISEDNLPPIRQERPRIVSNEGFTRTSSPSKRSNTLTNMSGLDTSSMREELPSTKRRRIEGSTCGRSATWPRLLPLWSSNHSIGSWMSSPSKAALDLRSRIMQAKRKHEEVLASSTSPRESLPGVLRNPGDENEACMKIAFPNSFERIQPAFNFSSPVIGQIHNPANAEPSSNNPRDHLYDDAADHRFGHSAYDTISSSNAVFNSMCRFRAEPLAQSEMESVSRLNPMQGIINDGVEPVSMHGNAAESVDSFIPSPNSDPYNGQSEASELIHSGPNTNKFPTPQMFREPLQVLSQPRLWSSLEGYDDHKTGSISIFTPPQQHSFTPLWPNRSMGGIREQSPSPSSHNQIHKDYEPTRAQVFQNCHADQISTPGTAQLGRSGIDHDTNVRMNQPQTSGYWN